MKISLIPISAVLATAPLLAQADVQEAAAKQITLEPGAAAPALEVSHWVKGEPVASFLPGRVYVVEFWATWCGPCIASIPHLSEIQAEHGDRVTVIGVSNRDDHNKLEQVREFVETRGDSMGYTVAFDEDRNTSSAWMEAAGRNGIPCSFLVDGEGQVAWIGHPMWLDLVLGDVLAGTWDPDEGPERIAAIEKELNQVYRSKSAEQALERADAFCEAHPELAHLVQDLRFSLLLGAGRLQEAYALGRVLADEAIAKKDPAALNMIAWTIVDPQGELDERDLELAMHAAVKAAEFTERKDANVLDTLARVHFLKGDLARAIAIQEEAVSLAPDRGDLQGPLEEYREALEGR